MNYKKMKRNLTLGLIPSRKLHLLPALPRAVSRGLLCKIQVLRGRIAKELLLPLKFKK